MHVKAAPGLRVPIEGKPRDYITDTDPVEVLESAYYLRRITDGDLLETSVEIAAQIITTTPAPAAKPKKGAD